MINLSFDSRQEEEIRIRSVYAKREEKAQYSWLYSWFNPANLFMIQSRERRMLALLKRFGFADLATKHIFEVGCGTGYWLREFIKWGGRPQNIKGIDLLVDHVGEARRLCPAEVRIECGSAGVLPFSNATFDLVLQSTVFSSVLDLALREQIACEMLRVVKDDGLILWYDFHMNNPWNPDVQGVKKKEISQLFPDCRIELHRITLAPPVVRLLAPHSWMTCYILEWLKVFNTHYLGVIRKL